MFNPRIQKRVYDLGGGFHVGAHAFVSVNMNKLENDVLFEYFNLLGLEHRSYAILAANHRTVLIEAYRNYQKGSEDATELDDRTIGMLNKLTYETLPNVVAKIFLNYSPYI